MITQIEVETLDICHYRLELWQNLSEMKKIALANDMLSNAVQIKFSLIAEEQLIYHDSYWKDMLKKNGIKKLKAIDYSLLGYDVADREFVSALFNCGYKNKDRSIIDKKWKQGLNDYGLFMNYREAYDFADESNIRIIDHAPFFVYALYNADEFNIS